MLNIKTIVAMESLKNLNEKVSLNFNLREPHKMSGATNVYAVVKLNGKQTKIAIGCKVNAWCWDAKRQMPKVSQNMAQQDIENAMQLNSILNDVRTNFYLYLCSGEPITENAIKEILSNSNHDNMVNKNAIPPKRTKTASKLINEEFERHYGNKKGTASYRTAQIMIQDFFEFVKQPNIYDSVATLSKKGMAEYKEYLEQKARAKGSGTNVTIEKKVNYIIMLINELSERYDNITTIKRHKIIKTISKTEDKKKRALTNEEVKAFEECDLRGDKQLETYRDIFVMQLESGVRVSDVEKLFNNEYKTSIEDGKEMQTILTQKRKTNAIVIVTPTIKALQRKYPNGLPFTLTKAKKEDYNEGLKKIFEIAKLTQEETFVTEFLGVKKQETKRLCDIISSHFARHTFITNMVKKGFSVDYLCYLTGHSDDTMIKEIYTHLTQTDKNRIVVKELERIENKQQANESETNTTSKQQRKSNIKEDFELRQFVKNLRQKRIEIGKQLKTINNEYLLQQYEQTFFQMQSSPIVHPSDLFNIVFDGFPTNSEREQIAKGVEPLELLNKRLSVYGVLAIDKDFNIIEC